MSKEEYKYIERQIDSTNELIYTQIDELERKIDSISKDIKVVFKSSIKNLMREIKGQVLENCNSFPLDNDQVKSLLDLKADIAGKI